MIDRVIFVGKDTKKSVNEIMTSHLISLQIDCSIFEGLMKMIDHHITHLLAIVVSHSKPDCFKIENFSFNGKVV